MERKGYSLRALMKTIVTRIFGLKRPVRPYPLFPSPEDYSSIRLPGSPDNTVRFILPGDERFSIESRRRANIALSCFNEINHTQYELVEALACKGFLWDGCYYHCNFTAKLCDSNIDPKLFFAEMVNGGLKVGTSWVVKACLILEGRTSDSCNLCSGVTHPTHGFTRGIYKSLRKGNSLTVPKTLTEAEQCCVRAEIALESYNQLHGANYELVETSLSKRFFALTSYWYHCNFYAKQYDVSSGKYVQRAFFAEMSTLQEETGETLTVTACILMEGKATFGCHLCFNVVHPTDGFVAGLKPLVK